MGRQTTLDEFFDIGLEKKKKKPRQTNLDEF